MEERKPLSHIAAGLLIALAVILVSVLLAFLSGANAGTGVGWIGFLVMIFGLMFFIQRYGKALNYRASFGDYFNYGFKATTLIVLLYVVYLLGLAFLVPDIKQKVLEATRLELEKRKNFSDSEIENTIQMTNKYFWLALIGTSMFFLAFIGAIGSLIGAAVTKKLPKNPFESTSL